MKRCCQNCRHAVYNPDEHELFCTLNWWELEGVEEDFACGAFEEEHDDDFLD